MYLSWMIDNYLAIGIPCYLCPRDHARDHNPARESGIVWHALLNAAIWSCIALSKGSRYTNFRLLITILPFIDMFPFMVRPRSLVTLDTPVHALLLPMQCYPCLISILVPGYRGDGQQLWHACMHGEIWYTSERFVSRKACSDLAPVCRYRTPSCPLHPVHHHHDHIPMSTGSNRNAGRDGCQ